MNRESSIVNRKSSIALHRPCFSYHLGNCSGACIGEEPAGSYNARVEQAFEDRRIVAWPYRTGIVVEESGHDGRRELFLVDNWVLVGSLTRSRNVMTTFVPTIHRFDYDTYKLLYTFISRPGPTLTIRTPTSGEWKKLLHVAS